MAFNYTLKAILIDLSNQTSFKGKKKPNLKNSNSVFKIDFGKNYTAP